MVIQLIQEILDTVTSKSKVSDSISGLICLYLTSRHYERKSFKWQSFYMFATLCF